MAFLDGSWEELGMRRYTTLEQARRGHKLFKRAMIRAARKEPRPRPLIRKGGKP
jgi:hypothetical protein